MAMKARNVQILGVNMDVTQALREHVEKHLGHLKNLLSEATSVIVRLCGPKKSGYASKIQVEAHFKGKIITTEKYLRRRVGDFYGVIDVAMKSWMRALAGRKDKTIDHSHERRVKRTSAEAALA